MSRWRKDAFSRFRWTRREEEFLYVVDIGWDSNGLDYYCVVVSNVRDAQGIIWFLEQVRINVPNLNSTRNRKEVEAVCRKVKARAMTMHAAAML